ncbi:hypothetical protein PIB30_060903, partial [Stylosanthes scabra]|nr:hypothetical protein [Stylosanthes scabra]
MLGHTFRLTSSATATAMDADIGPLGIVARVSSASLDTLPPHLTCCPKPLLSLLLSSSLPPILAPLRSTCNALLD